MIDAHHHLWDPTRFDYPWMSAPELAPIRRPFGLADLRALAAAHGITGTVLVQCRSSLEETRWFLDLAAAEPLIKGVVGWVDLTADDLDATLDALLASPGGDKLTGVRHQVHDEEDPAWLTRADVARGLATVAARGLVVDLLVRTRELPAAIAAVAACPTGRFVLDHVAKPPLAHGWSADWAEGVAALARLPNVWCKLSGLVTEARWDHWTTADLEPAASFAFQEFGPERVMFGGDWPVCLLASDYGRWLAAARELTPPAAHDAVFGGTARAVYGL